MASIDLSEVTKAWNNVHALQPTSMSIADGELVAILGPSGCGKSTLLFMLAGIYTPTNGSILFDQQCVNEVEAKDRNVGIVFQSYALYPHMSVKNNIMFPLKFNGTKKVEAEEKAIKAAELVHVGDLLDRRPNQLSGGQQQRVALARALVKEPQLLLLDEPLSNLDATLRHTMRSEIKALQQRLGVTTILVTHDQIEAITMADRIICMSRGKIEQIGTPEELYRYPESIFVATFIGTPAINLFKGKGEGKELRIQESRLRLEKPFEGNLTLGIRPEDIHITNTGIEGKIVGVEPMGREKIYMVATPLGDLRVLVSADDPKTISDTVYFKVPNNRVLVFSTDDSTLLKEFTVSFQ